MVSHLRHNGFYYPNVTVKRTIQSPTEEPLGLDVFRNKIYRSYLNTIPQKVLDNPIQYMEIEMPNKPMRMTGFRPMLSESLLQYKTVHAWVAKNNDSWGQKTPRSVFQSSPGLVGSLR
jgi:hypothetical protein